MGSRIRSVQTTFQAGQIDAKAIGRNDIGIFSQSAQDITNWRMLSTGAIERRQGTKYLADMVSSVRLIPFEFDDTQLFLFALENGQMRMFDTDGTELATSPLAITGLTTANMYEVNWTQSGDFMFLVHQDFATKEIQRTAADTFTVSDYAFDLNDAAERLEPFSKFAAIDTTMALSGTGSPIVLTASVAHFVAAHVTDAVHVKWTDSAGDTFVYEIVAPYINTTTANATKLTSGTPASTAATKQWTESAVNSIRGYPGAIAFHAGRLWLGGFKSLPAHLAASKVGLFYNFDVDDASAEDAIFAPIDADRINTIQHIVSGHNLQIFTDLAELHISEEEGAPITPTNIAIRTNTRYGSCNCVSPLVFDDATIYIQHQRKVVREYLWNSLNRGYTSNPLSLLANDIIGTVKEMEVDYGGENGPEQYAYILNTDGNISTYHALRSEEINGFMPWTTNGTFDSIVVVGDILYAVVQRTIAGATVYWLEKFDLDVRLDGAVEGTSGSPTGTFTGFTQYADQTVHVTAEDNGYYLGEYTISAAGVLDMTADGILVSQVWVGLTYTSSLETLPVNFGITTGSTEQLPKRLVSAFVRMHASYDFALVGQTFIPRNISFDVSLPPTAFTGIRRAFRHGVAFDQTAILTSDIPLPCTILTLGMEVAL